MPPHPPHFKPDLLEFMTSCAVRNQMYFVGEGPLGVAAAAATEAQLRAERAVALRDAVEVD